MVNEPSIVAINKNTGEVEAVGKEAKEMLGRTPGNIVAIKPMKDGVIADFKVTEKMLNYFIQKAHNRKMLVHPRIVIGVPSEITQVEKRAVEDSAYRAKASEVYLVEQAMVAAIGAGLPITEPSGNMVVDIGGGTTDIAVISLSGIVYSRSVRMAGNQMDEAITNYLKRKYNLLIGERTAEQIKIEIGSAFPLDKPLTMEIKGRNLIEGVPKTITIDDSEIREALGECIATIMNAIRVALERTPPELSADISDRGIVLTGGGALIKNLDKRIREETGLPVSIADDPLASVVLGTGKMLSAISGCCGRSRSTGESRFRRQSSRPQFHGIVFQPLPQRSGADCRAPGAGDRPGGAGAPARPQCPGQRRSAADSLLGRGPGHAAGEAAAWHGQRHSRRVVELRRSDPRPAAEQGPQGRTGPAQRLEEDSMAEDARQGQRLQALLGFKEKYVYKTVAAQVIGTSGTEQSQVLLIDKGSKDGIKPDMPVITPDGIVGKTRDVFRHTSQVLEISDSTSGAGVILEKTRIRGVLRGDTWGQPEIVNVSPDERIQRGEPVLTSGGDAIYPRGLAVGTVDRTVRPS